MIVNTPHIEASHITSADIDEIKTLRNIAFFQLNNASSFKRLYKVRSLTLTLHTPTKMYIFRDVSPNLKPGQIENLVESTIKDEEPV